MKPLKVTFARWALFQAGTLTCMSHGRATLRMEAGQWVMRGPKGEHVLNVAASSADRLDAHWQQFAKANF